jgi:C_GCAxxG_C_C family probable redox protein
MRTLSKEEIVRQFKGFIHCSQVVLTQWAEELGYDKDEASRMAAPFGGGMFRGDTCGAVAAAMIAIGMRYGHSELGDEEGNAAMMAKVNEFLTKFREKHGSNVCRELCGFDFSQAGQFEAALASGILFEKCPDFVASALEILDEIM